MYTAFVKQVMIKEMKRQEALIDKLNSEMYHDVTNGLTNYEQGNYS